MSEELRVAALRAWHEECDAAERALAEATIADKTAIAEATRKCQAVLSANEEDGIRITIGLRSE